jgi:hypothetical protein
MVNEVPFPFYKRGAFFMMVGVKGEMILYVSFTLAFSAWPARPAIAEYGKSKKQTDKGTRTFNTRCGPDAALL